MSATILLEGYDFSKFTGKEIYPTAYRINAFINGVEVFTDSTCLQEKPCKLNVEKKSVLTICDSKSPARCLTGTMIEPTAATLQKFAYITILGTPFTVYRPEEMAVLDGFLAKQAEAEKQRDEIKNRAPY